MSKKRKYKHFCKRCAHTWNSKNPFPKSCGICKTRSWNLELKSRKKRKCKRCGKNWLSSLKKPLRCGICNNPNWDKLKKRKIKKVSIIITKPGHNQKKNYIQIRILEKHYRKLEQKRIALGSGYNRPSIKEVFDGLSEKTKLKIYPSYKRSLS